MKDFLSRKLDQTVSRPQPTTILSPRKAAVSRRTTAKMGCPLRDALNQDVSDTDDIVNIVEFLVDRNPALIISSRDQDGYITTPRSL
jgi:hypothetical protein